MSDTSDFDMSGDEESDKILNNKKKIKEIDDTAENGNIKEEENTEDKSEVRFPAINPFAIIKNKELRNKHFKKLKLLKIKNKRIARKARIKEGRPAKNPAHTIESLREKDQTAIQNLEDSDNEEVRKDLETDEFSEFYSKAYEPKVLITYADNPVSKTRKFGKELCRIIPNSLAKQRNRSSIKKMCSSAINAGFTDLIVINENQRQPNGLVIVHLPNGPTAHFKVSNVKITTELRKNHKDITSHRPEVILTNFTTRLGLNVGRMLGALFNHDPDFRGRRAVTFHNQRDYIFFRHHRYEFTKDGKRVKLKELGPRFTLRLRSMQQGLFDSKTGDYEWIITNKRHAMESRRKFFL